MFSTDWNEGTTRLVLSIDGSNVLATTTATNGVYIWKPDLSISKESSLRCTLRGRVNEVLTATFNVEAHDIVFSPGKHGSFNGGGPTEQRIPHGEAAVVPDVVPANGYRFCGWDADMLKVTSDRTLTAQYQAIPYLILYEDIRDSVHANPSTYTVEDSVTFSAPSSIPAGWRFVRWDLGSIPSGSTGTKIVRAIWDQIHYNVVFEPGSHGVLTDDVPATQSVAHGMSAALPNVVPASGYRFAGWSVDTSKVTGDVVSTAQYERISYSITYENLQGATHANPLTYTVEDVVEFSAPSFISRRKFVRWEPSTIVAGTMGEMTVRAVWETTPIIYVDGVLGNDANSGSLASQSLKTLTRAYELAEAGDVIQVAAGTYGPVSAKGKAVVFRGLDGSVIDGAGKARCVTADSDVVFENFTLQNGYDDEAGGGARGGTFNRCTICYNYSAWDGGGAYESTLWNCLIVGNTAKDGLGGGAYGGSLINCTVVDNASGDEGAGVYAPEVLANTIVCGNETDDFAGVAMVQGGSNWIGGDCGFEDAAHGDYRLQPTSSCCDAADNAWVKGVFDLAGVTRVDNGSVDIGAYERPVGVNEVVCFDANGGDANPEPRILGRGQVVGVLPTVSRVGYSFEGWFTAASGGTKVSSSTIVSRTVTYYAHWKTKNHTIIFDANGGVESSTASRIHEASLGILPEVECSGCVFEGWYTAIVGGTKADASIVVTTDLTFYAHWSSVICFNANGGENTLEPHKINLGQEIGILPATTRAGCWFGGWYTAPIGGTRVTSSTIATGPLELYAHWTEEAKPFSDQYMVIDLSGGTVAENFPIRYLADIPDCGWTDAYKTDKLVLRWVEPGNFTMGSPVGESGRKSNEIQHQVTLTSGFWMGVFEVTQRQWELVMGTRPSYFTNSSCYATRPVDSVSWDMIRGSSLGAGWPSSASVDADSFLGRLRMKTGGAFDLPMEAQWEYACRAGTTTAFNNGKNLTGYDNDANLAEVGRYVYNGGGWDLTYIANSTTSRGTAAVGSYIPNAWGLYDMHGNVWEWCLDWYEAYSSTAKVDPLGGVVGSARVIRGGGFSAGAERCRSGLHDSDDPTKVYVSVGFRISCSAGPSEWGPDETATVRFDTNGGDDAPESRTANLGREIGELPIPRREGYTFAGWFTALHGGSKVCASTIVRGDRTLYAHWTLAEHSGTELYMVVDLSGGVSSTWYPVTYLSDIPEGGWTDEYKTTKLVFRRIEPGTYMMGSPTDEVGRVSNEARHRVALTSGYWMGVFEVTQRQWALVMGTRPSYFSYGSDYATRPVEMVTYDMIRGAFSGSAWPFSSAVDLDSFLGKLQARTGGAFDLPTEAQWEYACRAGTTSALNNGKNLSSETQDANVAEVGRYKYNGSATSGGTASVGSFEPNGWGLYDMHGNVWEWCLDWYENSPSLAVTDPIGGAMASARALRGGSWNESAGRCRSAARNSKIPSGADSDRGFRLCCNSRPAGEGAVVVFDANGGKVTPTAMAVSCGQALDTLPDGDRTGYALVGWFTEANGGTQVTESTVVTGDVTYYAHWTANAYTIRFDANGGSGTMADEVFTYGDARPLTANVFTRTGYTFMGWAMTNVATTATYADKQSVENLTTTPNGVVTLYAVWSNGLSFTTGGDAPWSTRSGYSHNADGVAQRSGQIGDNQSSWIETTVAGPCELSFWWKVSSESGYDKLYLYVDGVEQVAPISGEKGWTRVVTTLLGGDHVVKWAYTKDARTVGGLDCAWIDEVEVLPAVLVTFDANGGDVLPAHAIVSGRTLGGLPTPLRNGYQFDGWFTEANGGTQVTESTVVTGDVTYYAHWTVNTYTVRFNANGGNGTMADEVFTNGVARSLTANAFTRMGYTFMGWAMTSSATTAVYADKQSVENLTATPNGVVTLYAMWSNGLSFTTGGDAPWSTQSGYSHNADGVAQRSGQIGDNQSSWIETTVVGPCELSFWWKVSSESGYDKLHLYVDGVEQVSSISGEKGWTHVATMLLDGEHVVKWAYTKDARTVGGLDCAWIDEVEALPAVLVTFDANGGDAVPIRAVVPGRTLGELPNPLRSGYRFDGWFTSVSGGTQVSPSMVVMNEVTYYAHWTKVPQLFESPYVVIDLSGGVNDNSYPVTCLDAAPSGGWTDEYKTEKLVLRRIEAGSVPERDCRVTKPFYIGVFEVTQRQWELVMGTRPSHFTNETYYAARPVEKVSYDMIRGSSVGASWPRSDEVDETSFLGVLRKKIVGSRFDLPTEAQWEYACRAGTTTDYNNGTDMIRYETYVGDVPDSNMDKVGRYLWNRGDAYARDGDASNGTAIVGSYIPNAWGLYDMHGNVSEWCLDWYQYSDYLVGDDPVGAFSNALNRIMRGGDIGSTADDCRSWSRVSNRPYSFDSDIGFRLCCSTELQSVETMVIVTFDSNGGETAPVQRMFDRGMTIGSLPGATRVGCEFGGWYTAADGGTRVSEETVVTGDVVYYAHWAFPYVVRFNANGGSGTMADETFTYDVAQPLTANAFMRTDYSLVGWAMTSDATDAMYADMQSVKNLTATPNGVVTLYAVWQRSLASALSSSGQTFMTGGNAPWFVQMVTARDADGAAQSGRIGHNQSSWLQTTVVGPCRLSFWWKVSSESWCDKLRWYLDGTEQGGAISGARDWAQVIASIPSGEHIVKWSYIKDVSGSAGQDCAWIDQVGMVAMVTFDASGAPAPSPRAVVLGREVGELPTPTRTGYAFEGWFTSPSGGVRVTASTIVTADVTYYAQWRGNPYTVRFDANGGEGTMGDLNCTYGTGKTLTACAFTRSGYTFAGWAKSAGGAVMYADRASVTDVAASGAVTLYAKWTANAYSVKFNANGGSGSMSNESMTYDAGKTLTMCAFMRTGYTFVGWATSANGGVVYGNGQSVKNLTATQGAVINLYAKWTANAYMVKFNANGGQGTMADEPFTYDAAAKALTTCAFTRKGYTFAGWATSVGGAVKYADGATVKNLAASGMATLYAKWTPNAYVIDFNPGQGGEGTMSDLPMTYDEAEALYPNLFHRTGYTFLGWTDNPNEVEEVLYYDGVVVENLTDEVDGEFDLYAIWAANEYTVKFNANGGKGTMADQDFLYDEEQNLTSNGFVRAGCEFLGWAATEDGGSTVYADGEAVSNLTVTADGVVNLYAVWDGTATTWMEDDSFVAAVANTYDGYLIDGDYNLFGVVQVKTTKQSVKTTTDKKTKVKTVTTNITATATVTDANGKKWSYSKGVVTVDGVVTGLKCTTKGCPVPEFGVKVGKNGMEGEWREYEIFGARNGMGTKGDAMKAALEAYKGKWSVTLSCASLTSGQETASPLAVRLQFDVQAKGVVKIAGNWENGAKVSASAQMVMGDGFAYVPVMVKSTKTSPALNALLRIDANAAATGMSPPQAVTLLSEGELVGGGRTVAALEVVGYLAENPVKAGAAYVGRVALNELAYPAKFTQKGLPTGLKINAATGVVSGTPTKPGEYVVTFTATSSMNSKSKDAVKVTIKVENYVDGLIPVKDHYGPYTPGVSYTETIPEAAGCTVSGLPTGMKWTAKDIKAKDGTVKTPANSVYGIPTKPGKYTVYFKKSVSELNAKGKSVKVTHTATATFEVSGYPTITLLPSLAVAGSEPMTVAEGAALSFFVGVKQSFAINLAGTLDGVDTTVSAKGLPAGLKLVKKTIYVDPAAKKKVVDHYEYVIGGVPTKASSVDKKTKVVVPSHVKLTASNKYKWSGTFAFDIKVVALPKWAYGTFNGGNTNGMATLTVSNVGKLSGKWLSAGLTWTLSAASYDAYISSEQMYVATVIGKSGKLVMTNEIEVTESGIVGFLTSGQEAASPFFEAWRNGWKEGLRATLAKQLKGKKKSVGDVALTVGANGTVTAKGTFVTGFDGKKQKDITYSASCSTVLIPTAETGLYRVYLYFPPKSGKFDGFSACESVMFAP